jgi:pentatricopeptide repeat domain-containing protein 1
VVRRLPPEASAVKAINQGLYYLDSGALAALLKELNKSGHVRRAQEVRAWAAVLGGVRGASLRKACSLCPFEQQACKYSCACARPSAT